MSIYINLRVYILMCGQSMRVGVVGLGAMGQNHARIYSTIPGCELVAVADIDDTLTRSVSNKYGAEPFNDYKLMLKKDLDAVSIAVPTSLHYEVASFFLENGIHCLVEKPITKTLEEAYKLVELAKKKNRKLMVGHIERYNPAVKKMKEIIDSGMLGKILIINTRRVGPFTPRVVDVGILIDLATHDIDVVRYLYGKEPSNIYSKFGSIKHPHEDYAVLLLDFGESTASIEVNWFTPHKVRTAVVTGTDGIAYMDYMEQSIVVYNSEWKMEPKVEKEEPLKAEIEHFISCIKDDKEPLTSGEEGLKNLEVAYRSLVGGKSREFDTLRG
ncbi:MAG: Gfo/Idh/MocA family oxidoreductase [Candidatus Methanomethylicaceae archaeon]